MKGGGTCLEDYVETEEEGERNLKHGEQNWTKCDQNYDVPFGS